MIKPSILIGFIFCLHACGGSSTSYKVCSNHLYDGTIEWYYCTDIEYSNTTDNVPAPYDYFIRTYYDAYNSDHVASGRAYVINGVVYAVGSGSALGVLNDGVMLVETKANYYVIG